MHSLSQPAQQVENVILVSSLNTEPEQHVVSISGSMTDQHVNDKEKENDINVTHTHICAWVIDE